MNNDLVLTKFIIPPSRPNLVLRERLKNTLDESIRRQHRLILVSSRAGSGKTTLVCEWLHSCDLPSSWLSLDENDNNPFTFFSHLSEALNRLGINLDKRDNRQLSLSPLPDAGPFINRITNAITLHDQPFILVLDDLHHIQSDWIHQSLERLIDNTPPSVIIVLISRTDPPLPLSRLRASDQLTEIRSQDLRFSLAETTQFLRDTMELELPPELVSKIEKRTEGWIAGLQLTAISLKGSAIEENPSNVFQGLDKTNRFILDYLAEEVLRQQPTAVQDFLLETSILKALNGPLCDAIRPVSGTKEGLTGQVTTGDVDPLDTNQSIIEYLARTNLFVIPLDTQHNWYRYHHLFADLLNITLSKTRTDKDINDLHSRAARWHAENGSIDQAMHHAITAGDYETAAAMINDNFAALFSRNEVPVFLTWIDKLPPTILQKYPWIVLYQAYTFALSGKADHAESLLTQVEKWSSSDQPDAASASGHVTAIRAYLANLQQDGDQALALADSALSQLQGAEALAQGMAAYARADTHIAQDQMDAAEIDLKILLNAGEKSGHLLLRTQAQCESAAIQIAKGKLNYAESILEQVKTTLSNFSEGPSREICAYDFTMADFHRERNQLDDSLSHVREGLKYREQFGGYLVIGDLALMQVLQSMGDVSGALETLAQAEKYFSAYKYQMALGIKFRAARVTQWLLAGDLRMAQQTAKKCGNSELEIIARSKLHLALGQTDQAFALLNSQLIKALEAHRNGRVIDLLLLLSQGHQALDKTSEAIQFLEDALALAKPERYARPFVEFGQPLLRLLDQILPNKVFHHSQNAETEEFEAYRFEINLIDALRQSSRSHQPDENQSTPLQSSGIQLTEREQEVLALLAEGITNKEIASRLVVSPSTIKQHLKSVYRKLEVNSRTQAVLQARNLGLI